MDYQTTPSCDDALCRPAPQFSWSPGNGLLVRAPAKLNLALRVGPRSSDGFHRLDSVVVKVTAYDELVCTPADDAKVSLQCRTAAAGPTENNLALRAARALRDRLGKGGVAMALTKRIAIGAGLGGGSSDAAAALLGLNRLWSAGLTHVELARIGQDLGSDVPLFLGPPAARMRGRGEQISPLAIPGFAAVLVTPPIHAATAEVYRAFDEETPGPLTAFDPGPLQRTPPSQWAQWMTNDLFPPACRRYPVIARWAERLSAATGRPAQMTGSGSALFVLGDDVSDAQGLYDRLTDDLRARAWIVQENPW